MSLKASFTAEEQHLVVRLRAPRTAGSVTGVAETRRWKLALLQQPAAHS